MACLPLDYGPWDEGDGEREHARAGVVLLAAAGRTALAGVSALAPTGRLAPD